MPINPFVCNPERIVDLVELEDVLARMETYRKEYEPDASEVGVLLIQNRQLGAIYIIESKENAERKKDKPISDDGMGNRSCEWGVRFYPRSYFERLRERLSD